MCIFIVSPFFLVSRNIYLNLPQYETKTTNLHSVGGLSRSYPVGLPTRPVRASGPNAVEPTLTVGEARDFFEYQFSEMAPYMTKATGDRPVGMMPGDFTPLWDKARIGANREMDGADVPIDPKFIFVAVFNKITPEGDTLRQTVDITQKLVVKKWRDTSDYKAFCYIASIVPTPEYYARHRNVGREFRYAGGKGSFSGFVIYRTLTGRWVGVDTTGTGSTRDTTTFRESRRKIVIASVRPPS